MLKPYVPGVAHPTSLSRRTAQRSGSSLSGSTSSSSPIASASSSRSSALSSTPSSSSCSADESSSCLRAWAWAAPPAAQCRISGRQRESLPGHRTVCRTTRRCVSTRVLASAYTTLVASRTVKGAGHAMRKMTSQTLYGALASHDDHAGQPCSARSLRDFYSAKRSGLRTGKTVGR